MKILHLCLASFFRENYSYQENILPKYHNILGHETFVIASCESIDSNSKERIIVEPCVFHTDGYYVRRIRYRVGINSIRLRKYEKLYEEIEKITPDFIFIHGCQFSDIKYVIKYLKKHSEVRAVCDNHADYINSASNWISKNILHKLIWRYYAKKSEPYINRFFGVTPNRCTFLTEMYNIKPEKIKLLVMGADDEKISFETKDKIKSQIRKELSIDQNDFVIVTGGKIDKRKNTHLLMQAIKEINNDKIKLISFGTPTSDMKKEIEALSKSELIKNVGWINSDKTYEYYLTSDLAIFPGTHSVLWEQAIGTGLPCVFKYWKGMDHVNIGDNCMFLVKDTVEEIKKIILKIYNDKELFENMRTMSIEKGIKEFSFREIAKRSIEG